MGLGDVFDDGEAKDRAPHLSAAGLVYAVEAFKKPRQMLLIYATPLVTAKIGIDISGNHAKSVNEFLNREFDYVVTVCDCAKQTCPFFAGGKELIHRGFEDPAEFSGDDEEKMATFRRVRDEIRDWVEEIFGGEATQDR
jgi:hypothetical protein